MKQVIKGALVSVLAVVLVACSSMPKSQSEAFNTQIMLQKKVSFVVVAPQEQARQKATDMLVSKFHQYVPAETVVAWAAMSASTNAWAQAVFSQLQSEGALTAKQIQELVQLHLPAGYIGLMKVTHMLTPQTLENGYDCNDSTTSMTCRETKNYVTARTLQAKLYIVNTHTGEVVWSGQTVATQKNTVALAKGSIHGQEGGNHWPKPPSVTSVLASINGQFAHQLLSLS